MGAGGLIEIAAGPYCSTYDGDDAGEVEGLYRLQTTAFAREVRGSKFGDTILDFIYRGLASYMVATFKEWKPVTQRMFWPWDAELGYTGQHGRLGSDMAKPFQLTAVPGTSAAQRGPVTVTLPAAIMAPQHTQEWSFGMEERLVPIVLLALPCKPTGEPALSSRLELFRTT